MFIAMRIAQEHDYVVYVKNRYMIFLKGRINTRYHDLYTVRKNVHKIKSLRRLSDLSMLSIPITAKQWPNSPNTSF